MLSRNSSLWSAKVSVHSLWKGVVHYLSKVTLTGQELFPHFMWKQSKCYLAKMLFCLEDFGPAAFEFFYDEKQVIALM